MLLNKDGSLKGSPHLNELIKEGVAPQALVSYMISSGYGDPENIYPSMESFAKDFNYKEIHKNNGKFDRQKLDSINKKIITSLSPEMYLDSIFIFLQKNNRGDIFDTLSNDTELKEIVSSVRRKPAEVISLIERILKPKHNTYDPSLKEVLDKLFIFLTQNNYQLPTAKEISVDEASLNNALRWILTGDRSFPSIEKVVTYLETKGELKARIELAESFYKIN